MYLSKMANRYGVTPLSLAADNASADFVDLLVSAGADAKAVVNDGETVLMAAARTGKDNAGARCPVATLPTNRTARLAQPAHTSI